MSRVQQLKLQRMLITAATVPLIMYNKYAQADVAHNSVNRSHGEQHTRTN